MEGQKEEVIENEKATSFRASPQQTEGQTEGRRNRHGEKSQRGRGDSPAQTCCRVCWLVICSVSFKRVWRQSSFFAHTKSQLTTQVVQWGICILKLEKKYKGQQKWGQPGNASGLPWQWGLRAGWKSGRGQRSWRIFSFLCFQCWFDSRKQSVLTQKAN